MTSTTVFKSEEGRKNVLDRYNQILSGLPVGKKFIDTTYGRTFLIESGRQDGPAVVLLHGSCSSVFPVGKLVLDFFWSFQYNCIARLKNASAMN